MKLRKKSSTIQYMTIVVITHFQEFCLCNGIYPEQEFTPALAKIFYDSF